MLNDQILIKSVSEAFLLMNIDFDRVFQNFYPSKNSNGFTERNQTFYFAKNIMQLEKSAICWQEVPFGGIREHIDTVIYIPDYKAVIYIEAKRIKSKKSIALIKKDVSRLGNAQEDITRRFKELEDCVNRYAIILSDVWVNPQSRFKSDFISKWKKNDEMLFGECGIINSDLLLKVTPDDISEKWKAKQMLNTNEGYHLLLAMWKF